MEQLLSAIEDYIMETVAISDLSNRFYISAVHLQRLFKFAFGIPLAGYIRSRKLAASVEKLLSTDYCIIDIANEYGPDIRGSRRLKNCWNVKKYGCGDCHALSFYGK